MLESDSTAEDAEVAEVTEKEIPDQITENSIGAAIEVHRALGPGLLESAGMIKAMERLAPVHQAQMLSYLKLSGCKVGLLINFHVQNLKDGIRRVVNSRPDSLRSRRPRR